jgi:major membrane immunogen (membrane-anchored lipoprotein)
VTATAFGSKTFICINTEKQSINMKKILYSVFMLATMVLAACSSDDITEPAVKRGMVLKANVEDTDTRATLTDNEGKWKFAFATNDEVKVGNDQVTDYYTFKNNGTEFASADALQTTTPATWCAFFPGEKIDLANQSGDLADVANKYALAGATATPTTGSDGLTVTMKAKAAVLRIVGVNKDESLDISVKTAEGYVSGLTAVKNSADFRVQTSTAKVTLLSKPDAGVYYVVVPAGVKLSVFNGSELIKATKAGGLTAGKYYTLKTGNNDGWEYATINGEQVKKFWVQLWPGGPKFATENVAKTLNWSEATAKGSAYVWGANWRTPTKDEMNFVNTVKDPENEHNNLLIPLNTKAEIQVQNGKAGILYTGIQPGYTDKSIFLPFDGDYSYFGGDYWTSTEGQKGYGTVLDVLSASGIVYYYRFWDQGHTNTKYMVRPVLAE